MARDHRKKASEVFAETNYVFSKKSPFAQAFPQVESFTMEYEQTGDGVQAWNAKGVVTQESVGEYMDCPNSLCYNGGFSVGNILRSMVYAKETEREGLALCQGNEGSPRGRRIYRKCMNHWKYRISIVYRTEQPPAASSAP